MKKYDRNEGGTSQVAMNLSSFLNITELLLKFAKLRRKFFVSLIRHPSFMLSLLY